ncbi:MAG: hypothetical protein ACJ749_11770, partial [Flavisolibacter sp.]
LILRNFLVLVFLPMVLAWIISAKIRLKPIISFSAMFLFFIVLFFTAKYLHPSLDFAAATVKKQREFLKLEGGSTVAVSELKPTAASFVLNAPEALSLSIARPYPSDVRHLLSLVAATEISIIMLVFIIFLFWRKNGTPFSPFLLFCLFFSFAVLMVIGYTVNNLGAIVRYRSIVLPLIIVPMAAKIDWERINRLIFGNIKNTNNV